MKIFKRKLLPATITAALLGVSGLAGAVAVVQCPEDIDGDGNLSNNADIPNVQCQHLTGGDVHRNDAIGAGRGHGPAYGHYEVDTSSIAEH